MAEDLDVPLTIALAEYEHLRELSRTVHDQSAARFAFFLTVASAATAVSAGLITTGPPDGRVGPAVLAGLGLLVLLLGISVFARQVELNDRGRRYAVASTALRTYLARRAPELAPFLIMPTLDDPGPFAPEPFRRHWFRDLVSQAGMIALVNSVLLGLAAALATMVVGPAWLATAVAALMAAGSVALHLYAIRQRIARSADHVGAVLAARRLPDPALGHRPRTSGVDQEDAVATRRRDG